MGEKGQRMQKFCTPLLEFNLVRLGHQRPLSKPRSAGGLRQGEGNCQVDEGKAECIIEAGSALVAEGALVSAPIEPMQPE